MARLGVVGLAFNEDVEPGPRQRDEQLQQALLRQGVAVQRSWDQLLVPTAAGGDRLGGAL